MAPIYLGEFEYAVLLAVLHLDAGRLCGPHPRADRAAHRPAGGARRPVHRARPPRGQGLPQSRMGDATEERGGKARRYYTVTRGRPEGHPRDPRGFASMTKGLESILEQITMTNLGPDHRRSSPNSSYRSSFEIRSIASRSLATSARSTRAICAARRHIERARGGTCGRAPSIAVRYGVHAAAPPQAAGALDHDRRRRSPTGRGGSGLTRDVLYAWRAIGQRPLLSSAVVDHAGARAGRQQHDLQPDGRAGAAAVPFRRRRSAASSPRPWRRTPTSSIAINVTAADFREWREQSTHGQGLGDVPVVGRRTSRASTFPSRCRRSSCRRDSLRCWASRRSSAASSSRTKRSRASISASCLGTGCGQRRFASDPNIVGKSVRLDGEPYEVVGVAPQGFSTPDGAEVWAPLALTDRAMGQSARRELRHRSAGSPTAQPSSRRGPS